MYPILEYDSETEAFIEPSKVIQRRDMPEYCVICFFKEIIEKVVEEHDAKLIVENRWEDGTHPVYEIEYREQRLAFFHPGIGNENHPVGPVIHQPAGSVIIAGFRRGIEFQIEIIPVHIAQGNRQKIKEQRLPGFSVNGNDFTRVFPGKFILNQFQAFEAGSARYAAVYDLEIDLACRFIDMDHQPDTSYS